MSILPDWLTGYDAENAERAAAADAELQRLNALRYTSEADKRAVADDYARQGAIGTTAQRNEIDDAFTDKLDSQAQSIIGGPLGALWATVSAVLKAIPLWLWIVAAVAAFLFFGGGNIVRSLAKKHFK